MSVVDLRSSQEVAFARFEDQVQELFAVTVLPHRFPEMILLQHDLVSTTYSLSDESLRDVAWGNPAGAAAAACDSDAADASDDAAAAAADKSNQPESAG